MLEGVAKRTFWAPMVVLGALASRLCKRRYAQASWLAWATHSNPLSMPIIPV